MQRGGVLLGLCVASAVGAAPSLDEMAGDWIDLTRPVSAHVNSSELDLPMISNFHGSCGSSPNGDWGVSRARGGVSSSGVRPVDLFAVNSLEIPPFAGCGNAASRGTPDGCGRLLIDQQQVVATSIQYRADQVSRRGHALNGSLAATSKTRMLFEQPGVLWQLNLSNPTAAAVHVDVEFELAAMVTEHAHVAWVQPLPHDPANFTYSRLEDGMQGVLSVGSEQLRSESVRPATALYAFVETPDQISVDGSAAMPRALFRKLAIPPRSSRQLHVILTICRDSDACIKLAKPTVASAASFQTQWDDCHARWEARWQSTFDDFDPFFTGAAPILDLDGADVLNSAAANVTRVYYASVLSIVSQMRTNLPLMYKKVWPTSQGSNEALRQGGVVIGGAISYFWDEALSSTLLALLEPDGRPKTLMAWFTADLKGKKHNWFDLDCGPDNPIGTVYGPCNFTGKAPTVPSGRNVYPYNIWSYGVNIFNYLRTSNDSIFLASKAGTSNLTVDQALEDIVMDWRGSVIPGTRMTDYGTNLDGFSRTYMHVLPGMQGNNIWMMRQLARLRELQGRRADAAELRAEASAMANETIRRMFATSTDGTRGWWNVIWPADAHGTGGALQAHEMRHVVDFFSMAFGLCGVSGIDCDLDASQRSQLSEFFHKELQTSDWIRATSPACNCNNSYLILNTDDKASEKNQLITLPSEPWPGLQTCNADREDHGTTGAYTAWPALATEALCYIEGNCSSAFSLMASFAANTRQGAFGQANAVPQLHVPPFTPYNDEAAYKPSDRRYLNMAVGAFADAVVRGFFGYHPPPVWPSELSPAALTTTLMNPNTTRGFFGKLRNLRTPFGLATITSDESGLSIQMQQATSKHKQLKVDDSMGGLNAEELAAETRIEAARAALEAAEVELAQIRARRRHVLAPHPFTQDGLSKPRNEIGLALFDQALRAWGPGIGSVAIRDYTSTGLKQPMFPGIADLSGGATVDAGFKAGTTGTGDNGATGYSFNLAFRDELSGALIVDAQDELDMMMLYPDQLVDGVSCGHGIDCRQLGMAGVSSKLSMVHQDTVWSVNRIVRTSNWHKTTAGIQSSFRLSTVTSISTTEPELYLQVKLHNRLHRQLDLTVIPDQHGPNRTVGNNQTFVTKYGATDVIAVSDIGPANSDGWLLHVPPRSNKTFHIALRLCKHATIGSDECSLSPPEPIPHVPCHFQPNTDFQPGSLGQPAPAKTAEDCCAACATTADCAHASWNANEKECYLKDSTAHPVPWDPTKKGSVVMGCTPTGPKPPHRSTNSSSIVGPPFFVKHLASRIERAQNETKKLLANTEAKIPLVATGNRQLDEFYVRSVLSVLLCRLSNPAFAAVPFYELGNSVGESNSWDLSFAAGLLSWIEPGALEKMMKLMFKAGILEHSYLSWDGGGGGFYAQGPFSGMEMVMRVMDTAGNQSCLDWSVGDSTGGSSSTILQKLIATGIEMNTTFSKTRRDGLFDVGAGTGKMLEIEEDDYQHVIGAVNAMAVNYYDTLVHWCRDKGNISCVETFTTLGSNLKAQFNAKLWDDSLGWYGNLYPNETHPRTVLSYHTLEALRSFGPNKALASAVPVARQQRMLERFTIDELLAPTGLFSISRSDTAHWSREDCDWGGGGQYVGQTGRLAEMLFALSADEKGWQVVSRMIRWVERFPYFPQTIYGDSLMMQPHERNWFLQVSAGAGAQAIVNGIFGVRPHQNGTISFRPSYNASVIAPHARLDRYMFRRSSFSVQYQGAQMPPAFSVERDGTIVCDSVRLGDVCVVSS